jgi:hypothetical protein
MLHFISVTLRMTNQSKTTEYKYIIYLQRGMRQISSVIKVVVVALSSNNSMLFYHCNSYCKLDSAVWWKSFTLSAPIRHVNVLESLLFSYNVMLTTLSYIISTSQYRDTNNKNVHLIQYKLMYRMYYTKIKITYVSTMAESCLKHKTNNNPCLLRMLWSPNVIGRDRKLSVRSITM